MTKPKCYYCGEEATHNIQFGKDEQTGYVDDIDLCSKEECIKQYAKQFKIDIWNLLPNTGTES